MPTAGEHRRQAEHNERLALRCVEHFPDWAITALFYAALHWVEAYFYLHRPNDEPAGYLTHSERDEAVLFRVGQDAYTKFRFLEEQSRNARYRCTRFSPEDVNIARRDFYEPLRELVLPQR